VIFVHIYIPEKSLLNKERNLTFFSHSKNRAIMNTYTLDPHKSESEPVSTPTSVNASAPPPMPAPMYMPSSYPYYPYQYPQAPAAEPEIKKIRDWLAWSIISIFLGGLIPGFLPIIFSLICRSKKGKNDIHGARTMSTLALVFNIICTIFGILGLIGIFIYLFVYTKQMGNEIY
jgi:hypothetical protein